MMRDPLELRKELFDDMIIDNPAVEYLMAEYEKMWRLKQWVSAHTIPPKMRVTWYGVAYQRLREVADRRPGATLKTLRNAMTKAYPFKLRKGWPYTMWRKALKKVINEMLEERDERVLFPNGRPANAPVWRPIDHLRDAEEDDEDDE